MQILKCFISRWNSLEKFKEIWKKETSRQGVQRTKANNFNLSFTAFTTNDDRILFFPRVRLQIESETILQEMQYLNIFSCILVSLSKLLTVVVGCLTKIIFQVLFLDQKTYLYWVVPGDFFGYLLITDPVPSSIKRAFLTGRDTELH